MSDLHCDPCDAPVEFDQGFEIEKLRAELTSLQEHHDRVVAQRNKDWDALMVLVAATVGTDEEREAAAMEEIEEFDPWHALRAHAAELARMRPVYEAAIAWRAADVAYGSAVTYCAACEREPIGPCPRHMAEYENVLNLCGEYEAAIDAATEGKP